MLWVPRKLIQEILESEHDTKIARHMGQEKTIELVRWNFWWPKINERIIDFVQSCINCQRNKAAQHHPYGLSSPLELPYAPWQSIAMDFITDLHQEKKCASRRTGCVLTHQAPGTLWTHPGSAHTAPNAKHTGNVNSDAARHGTMRPDAAHHGICLPDGAWQGIFVLDTRCQGIFLLDAAMSGHFPSGCSRVRAFSFWTQPCQGIFLLDAAVSGHFPSGRSRVRAFSFWTQPCQGIFLLDAAMSGHFPSGRSRVRANGIRTTRVMAPWLCWLSRHGTS